MTAMSAVTARAPEIEGHPGSVTIRFSQGGEDIVARVALARRAWEEMGDKDLSFDEDMVRRAIERRLAKPAKHCLLQAERDGIVVGVLMGVAESHYHSPALGASILSWYVLREHRGSLAAIKLLHGFRRWAKNRGAVRLYVGISSGVHVARTDRLLKRLGFVLRGGNYMCAL